MCFRCSQNQINFSVSPIGWEHINKKKAKCARSSESLPTGLLCNQYNPECDGKSTIWIWAKFRARWT
jgi:hypothetical protein